MHARRFDDVADQDQGRLFGERIENGGIVNRHQDHVGSFDAFPASNGGTVEHFADFEEVVIQSITGRHGHVVLGAFGVCEAQINPFNVMIFDELNRLRHVVLRGGLGLVMDSPVIWVMPGANMLPRQPASQESKLHASAPTWVFRPKLKRSSL
ncbi:hypothetical protein D3C76_1255320 [compost metagenome]